MKFGGTSLGTADRLASVASIVKTQQLSYRPILVCSAMSSVKKASGTTSLLIKAAEFALHARDEASFLHVIETIEANHLSAVRAALPNAKDQDLLKEVEAQIHVECAKLGQFLKAVRIIDEISPKSRDAIVSTGEKLSCLVLTAVLQSKGIPAVFINASNLVEPEWQDAELNQTFYDYVTARLASTLAELTPASANDPTPVPVVTGFMGPIPGSLLASIGRGYTDLTAALVAVGMGAMELQIWKEVDGIFTADPRKVPSARLLPEITPDEAAELTYYGSEVIHPFTMDQVIRAGVPIRIKNTFNPQGNGTLVRPAPGGEDSGAGSEHSPGGTRYLRDPKHPTAVTIKDAIVVVNIRSNRKSNSHGFLSSIFAILDRHGVVVDLITTSEVHVSIALPVDAADDDADAPATPAPSTVSSPATSSAGRSRSSSTAPATTSIPGEPKSLAKVLAEFRKLGSVSVMSRQVILSVVGRHMRNMVGTSGKMFSILANEGVNIEMISQGASEINISCVIAAEASTRALRAVHDRLVRGVVVAHDSNRPQDSGYLY
ncbi:Aspartate/glutamate/uridylate kinase [Catenaria anguillulae PL171]|uniref:Aspartokinase n=1 Tax=Catenaria anguillulae PL171 TaxID=765915 RepID=A0A1Y2HYP8_9FUNG|nr:Aspartate/glutamate/uridylate kinase [Catenaria anguillulae PL171]